MATGAILAIGDELTTGQKVDTNSAWLSGRLLDRGIDTVEQTTVPDDPGAIAAAIGRLGRAADIVIATGGLGPTADDLTRQGLAIALGGGTGEDAQRAGAVSGQAASGAGAEELIEDAGALAEIERWFAFSGRDMPATNRVQALRPRSTACMKNGFGTAPGLRAQLKDAAVVFCLPGPPREMRPMFEASVLLELPAPDRAIVARFLHTFGAGESQVAEMLGDLMDRGRNPLVGTTASGAVVTCRLRADFDSEDAAASALDDTERQVRAKLGDLIFGEGDDTLPSAVIDLLRARSQTLATVESCTGGLLGAMLTEIPGVSDVYRGGWVTYTNEMKTTEVGVPRELLEHHGAVSAEVAVAMARGGRAASAADWTLAITGVAGPGGGSEAKPVGTVWIALAGPGDASDVRRFAFPGHRDDVRAGSAMAAMGMLRLHLIGRAGETLLRQAE